MWKHLGLLALLGVAAQVAAQCSPSPCGVNTNCEVNSGGAAVCRCQAGWNHEPGKSTIDGCPRRIQEQEVRPVSIPNRLGSNNIGLTRQPPVQAVTNPCQPSPCGTNADCSVRGDRPVCSCRAGYRGDPYTNCESNPCDQSPCGINAECQSTGSRAICKCPTGFNGDPFVRCNDNPCEQQPCGANADCTAQNGRAVCRCRDGYEGDPFTQCVLNPCLQAPCGTNAKCEGSGSRAVCKCLEGYEGDPFVSCTLNPCHNNPCGANADCQANGRSAVCKCRDGYVGDPFVDCQLEPCSNTPCGSNAECESKGRSAVCRCPRGHTGDPYSRCSPDPCSSDPCGAGAICENNGNIAVCKCPPGFEGDPNVSCRENPCASDPCGLNTECSQNGNQAQCKCLRGFVGSPFTRSGCRSDPCSVSQACGANAECRNVNGRPVCECLPGHKGDPYTSCVRGDCVANAECNTNQACKDYRCVDPCSFSCGPGAECSVQNHVAICKCPRGHTGDPFTNCRKFSRDEICAACGPNTDCDVGEEDRPICRCKQDYIGNPLTGCRRECERDNECTSSQQCVQFKCQPVCREGVCGENANCAARNNRPECTCPPDFLGEPFSRCYTECTRHDECSQNLACVKFKCKDPCREPNPNVCGQGANCEVKNHKPICSCPRGFTGDPFVSCRQFTIQDLCTPNPCGPNAQCQPGNDRSGSDRPVCICPTGFRGDPLVSCNRGECESDSECSTNQACYNFKCRDPCIDACGQGAQCQARNHGAICSCGQGFVGDPLTACRQTRERTGNVVGLSRFRRHEFPYFFTFY